ncbi:MAG TPA: arsenite efflux transporter metallochaperone ArsD [Candidatus Aquicultor sp.]|jgi:hypothetical protein
MKRIEIFDPAMCCSTGVCGPSVDKNLLRIATVINALKEKRIEIKRYGLSNEPQAFVANKVISDLLQKEGPDVLPVTLADGEIVKTREYSTNEELSEWFGTAIETKQFEQNDACGCGSTGCC